MYIVPSRCWKVVDLQRGAGGLTSNRIVAFKWVHYHPIIISGWCKIMLGKFCFSLLLGRRQIYLFGGAEKYGKAWEISSIGGRRGRGGGGGGGGGGNLASSPPPPPPPPPLPRLWRPLSPHLRSLISNSYYNAN